VVLAGARDISPLKLFGPAVEPTLPPLQWALEPISPEIKLLGHKDDY
jgi:hypothetical protein